MIQAEELRLGNLIINPIQGIIKVDTTIMSRVNNLNSLIKQGLLTKEDMFQPIPLTEDILLKIGFVFNDVYKSHSIELNDYLNELEYYNSDIYEIKFYDSDFTKVYIDYKVVGCKYLHELQNIFYVMEKQELDITKILEDG